MRLLVLALALLTFATPVTAAKLKVVATFSILGDITERVSGGDAEVSTLVAPESDAHIFEPTPAHARAVANADIVVMNGLGFEPWAQRLMQSTQSKARLVIASDGVTPRDLDGAHDPHAWQNVRNTIAYVRNISTALAAADHANANAYAANAAAYVNELEALDAEFRAGFARLQPARRRVITTHEAFGYFGAAYGIEFIAPLGLSTEQDPSAKGLAKLITQIRRERITAVFLENISDPRLIEQVARETRTKIGGKLYSDSLSTPGGPAPTYVAMMRHNAKLLTAAMAGGF